MPSEHVKTLIFVVWAGAVGVTAVGLGVTSGLSWIVVACAAVVPPVVARHFWRAPEQTMSESIQEARQSRDWQ